MDYKGKEIQKGLKSEWLLMKIKIVSWNVREAKEKNIRMIVRSFVRAQKVDLVCLQETKLQKMFIWNNAKFKREYLHSVECSEFSGS